MQPPTIIHPVAGRYPLVNLKTASPITIRQNRTLRPYDRTCRRFVCAKHVMPTCSKSRRRSPGSRQRPMGRRRRCGSSHYTTLLGAGTFPIVCRRKEATKARLAESRSQGPNDSATIASSATFAISKWRSCPCGGGNSPPIWSHVLSLLAVCLRDHLLLGSKSSSTIPPPCLPNLPPSVNE
jgi:hypothetical protein